MAKEKLVDYFTFQGKKYAKGTIVEFTDAFLQCRNYPTKYGYYNGCGLFQYYDLSTGKTSFSCAFASESETFVKEIITEIPYEGPKYVKTYKDTESNDMFYAWITYIFLMICCAFCHGAIYGWIALSIWFWPYRFKQLYQLKTHAEKHNQGGS